MPDLLELAILSKWPELPRSPDLLKWLIFPTKWPELPRSPELWRLPDLLEWLILPTKWPASPKWSYSLELLDFYKLDDNLLFFKDNLLFLFIEECLIIFNFYGFYCFYAFFKRYS